MCDFITLPRQNGTATDIVTSQPSITHFGMTAVYIMVGVCVVSMCYIQLETAVRSLLLTVDRIEQSMMITPEASRPECTSAARACAHICTPAPNTHEQLLSMHMVPPHAIMRIPRAEKVSITPRAPTGR